MTDIDSDEYWQTEFDITAADIERLVQEIKRDGRAFDVTELARNTIRGRLLNGPERSSRPALTTGEETTSVQWWDQVEEVRVGDHLIFLEKISGESKAYVGEVTDIEGTRLYIFRPGLEEPKRYNRYGQSKWSDVKSKYQEYRQAQRQRAREQIFGPEHSETIELVLLEFGDLITERLLRALRADGRFVRLSGRWFLAAEAHKLCDEQIHQLAWVLVTEDAPQLTETLAKRLTLEGDRDPWIFGVYTALREHPKLFRNVNPGPQPKWELAGPPPDPFTPEHSAYDPETFEVLVQPGIEADQRTVKRLWELELLDAVV